MRFVHQLTELIDHTEDWIGSEGWDTFPVDGQRFYIVVSVTSRVHCRSTLLRLKSLHVGIIWNQCDVILNDLVMLSCAILHLSSCPSSSKHETTETWFILKWATNKNHTFIWGSCKYGRSLIFQLVPQQSFLRVMGGVNVHTLTSAPSLTSFLLHKIHLFSYLCPQSTYDD